MENTVNSRVKQVRKIRGLTQKDFAERLKVTQQTVSQWEGESRTITEPMLRFISTTYDVNEKWLMTGEGSPFAKPQVKTESDMARSFVNNVCSRIFESLPPDIQDAFLSVFQKVAEERRVQVFVQETVEDTKNEKESDSQEDNKAKKTV